VKRWIGSKEDACVSHKNRWRSLGAVLTVVIGTQLHVGAIAVTLSAQRMPPVWDTAGLKQTAVSSFPVDQENMDRLNPQPPLGVRSFYINGIPYKGNETRLFCYYGIPLGEPPSGGWPGIVLVHGAGGTADALWVKWWNDKGYAAIAVDTTFRLPTASNWKMREKTALPGPPLPWGTDPAWNASPHPPSEDYWLYHAVADTILANNFLRQQPDLNPAKIGIVGVSWGGIIASHVVGIDSRFAFAIPVYGCGFLHESDGAQGIATFAANPEWDPSKVLGNADLPVFWTSGATDMHFTPEDRFKSKKLAMGDDPSRIGSKWSRWFMLPYIPHSGAANYNDTQFPEKINYVRFADAVLASMNANGGVVGDPELLRLTSQSLGADTAVIQYETETDVSNVTLFYTTSTNIWSGRSWSKIAEGTLLMVNHDSKTVKADIPAKTTAYFINLTEGSGTDAPLTVSSDLFFKE
jgi:dienelactone hydrolase